MTKTAEFCLIWGAEAGEVFIDDVSLVVTTAPAADSGTDADQDAETVTYVEGIDFESTTLAWEVFENVDNPALTFVDNPATDGINPSNRAAQITINAGGQPWAGTSTDGVEPFILDASNSTVTLMVYKDKISPVGFKLESPDPNGGTWGAELKQSNTVTGEWEQLTFDFSSYIDQAPDTIQGIVLFPDYPDQIDGAFPAREANTVMLFDSIQFSAQLADDNAGDTEAVELVTNGDFESGATGWSGNAANPVDDGGNSVNYANVAEAVNPWDVNLSQVLTLVAGETYQLTFRARASVARTIIAGVGENHDPWGAATETVNLTTEWAEYSYTFTEIGFGDDNCRVLFDMGAAVGEVFIDDVSLTAQ